MKTPGLTHRIIYLGILLVATIDRSSQGTLCAVNSMTLNPSCIALQSSSHMSLPSALQDSFVRVATVYPNCSDNFVDSVSCLRNGSSRPACMSACRALGSWHGCDRKMWCQKQNPALSPLWVCSARRQYSHHCKSPVLLHPLHILTDIDSIAYCLKELLNLRSVEHSVDP